MRYRHSLRFRILVAFVCAGLVLGPLLVGGLTLATYKLEESGLRQSLRERLARAVADPEDFPYRSVQGRPALRIIGNVGMSRLPDDLSRRAPGIHEYDGRGQHVFLGIADRGDARMVVVESATALEQIERVGVLVIIAGTLLSVYLALWLGYYLSRRLLRPLMELADEVHGTPADGRRPAIADQFADDEVGELARAIDQYNGRIREFLRREQDFAADASHEVRNPLAVIHGAAELLAADSSLDGTGRRAVERILRAAGDMDETVTALLLLAREPGGDTTETTDVAEEVAAAIRSHRHLIAGRDVEIVHDERARPSVEAPAIAVRVLVANLVRNAFGYTPSGHVTLCVDSDSLVIDDTGIGIPGADLPQIGRRGRRGSNVSGAGSGLGLSIAQRLCDRYGWTLTLESEPGNGTRVSWNFRHEFTNP